MDVAESPPLLQRVRAALRAAHYSHLTEKAYVGWIRRYILFHHKRHPADMGATEMSAFLSHLALAHKVAASTQTQALSALLFLYRVVLPSICHGSMTSSEPANPRSSRWSCRRMRSARY